MIHLWCIYFCFFKWSCR